MLASCQLSMNHLNDSISSSEFAIAINPNDEDALYYKGHALMRLKNYPDAIDYFIRHSKVRKENIEGLYNAALCHIYLDQYKGQEHPFPEEERQAHTCVSGTGLLLQPGGETGPRVPKSRRDGFS